ncbi:hypothetical protein DEU56DRAFT_747685 [Suillus clintonianus]|uniref:uncharacterized protein n=1 Tax=Suillus clintonianus TaxID=1904413 RepID=UPI001B88629D|nr:uncharacterized protein DEU56DRAFT_747685 [Suillus clintonianus]KAG2118432.1 hypothetical protein DEU56DRAFT_747685 [Suillus clintonianus]
MSPHYYQAYMQVMQSSATNAQGYTLSSTYMPQHTIGGTTSRNVSRDTSNTAPTRTHDRRPDSTSGQAYASWHQPGNCRCSRQGCAFTGSKKSVEIHMMDRHFIFPPGWQKKDEWDTDPSLKGKPIAIQGTSLILDSQEAIDGWIAERKNRFPTTTKVEDKKRKLEEAVARGQLTPEDMGLQGQRKRRKDDSSFRGQQPRGRGRGRGGGRGIGRVNHTSASVPRAQDTSSQMKPQVAPLPPLFTAEQQDRCDSDSSSDDGAPEVVSSKPPLAAEATLVLAAQVKQEISQSPPRPMKRPPLPQPKPPPRNPFASRPTLLRSLLLPEIRITVSNLSQAIRFLVDNDFLRGVEMKPGEAQQKMIEVVGSNSPLPQTAFSDPKL